MKKESNYSWLIGAGLGFVLGGPLGALLGGLLGKQIGSLAEQSMDGAGRVRPGDAMVTLLTLCAEVVKADGKVKASEIKVVKTFLIRHFGKERASEAMILFKDLVEGDYDFQAFEKDIARNFDISFKAVLIQLLLEIALADGEFHPTEKSKILNIAESIGLDANELNSLLETQKTNAQNDYTVLEVSPSASEQEIKESYRKLVKKYHPDKISHLGAEFQAEAQKKFALIQAAYERLTK